MLLLEEVKLLVIARFLPFSVIDDEWRYLHMVAG